MIVVIGANDQVDRYVAQHLLVQNLPVRAIGHGTEKIRNVSIHVPIGEYRQLVRHDTWAQRLETAF
jgi:hypothetical protein